MKKEKSVKIKGREVKIDGLEKYRMFNSFADSTRI